jgi:hypothetical protein
VNTLIILRGVAIKVDFTDKSCDPICTTDRKNLSFEQIIDYSDFDKYRQVRLYKSIM